MQQELLLDHCAGNSVSLKQCGKGAAQPGSQDKIKEQVHEQHLQHPLALNNLFCLSTL